MYSKGKKEYLLILSLRFITLSENLYFDKKRVNIDDISIKHEAQVLHPVHSRCWLSGRKLTLKI